MSRVWAFDEELQSRYSTAPFDPTLPVAAFDFDATLAPFRGQGPPSASTMRLLTLISVTHNLVIFSNRSTRSETAATPVVEYVEELDSLFDGKLRILVYMSCSHNRGRKPMTGMWERFLRDAGVDTVRPGSFYCGDAAGRPGDFADSDYRFALNIKATSAPGLDFITPEVLFGSEVWNQTLPMPLRPAMPIDPARAVRLAELEAAITSVTRCCVVMVGSPASGKSSIVKPLVAKLRVEHISNDLQGARSMKCFQQALTAGRGLIVDNTNPSREKRTTYARQAFLAGYKVVICHVSTPFELCAHLNAARMQGGNPGVPLIALQSYRKWFEPIQEELRENEATLIEVPFSLESEDPTITQMYY
jgi:bifunctional polynucleotide phosphatase/kinase